MNPILEQLPWVGRLERMGRCGLVLIFIGVGVGFLPAHGGWVSNAFIATGVVVVAVTTIWAMSLMEVHARRCQREIRRISEEMRRGP